MGERTARGLKRPTNRTAPTRLGSAPKRRPRPSSAARPIGPAVDVVRPPWVSRFGLALFFVVFSCCLFIGAAIGPNRPDGTLFVIGTIVLVVSGVALLLSSRVAVHIEDTGILVRNAARTYRIRYTELDAIRPVTRSVTFKGSRQEWIEMRALSHGREIRLAAATRRADSAELAELGPFLDRLRMRADQHGFDLVRPV